MFLPSLVAFCNYRNYKICLAHNLIDLLEKYGLKGKNCLHVKDEKYNLNVMINTLKFIMSCEVSGLEESFQEKCFSHVFSN
jgi:hypothetical protein